MPPAACRLFLASMRVDFDETVRAPPLLDTARGVACQRYTKIHPYGRALPEEFETMSRALVSSSSTPLSVAVLLADVDPRCKAVLRQGLFRFVKLVGHFCWGLAIYDEV